MPPPYRIDDEADALRGELDRHGIAAPVVLDAITRVVSKVRSAP